MEVVPSSQAARPRLDGPVWNLSWLTPGRCRLIFAVVVLLTFFSHWHFLTHHCPIDLSGDEAQYWDWSRHLGLSYYSKGPLIAYIIRASCALLGNTMPAVRFPALLLAMGTSICVYWITRRLFGSDRLALGAFLLGGVVPMYVAGSMLMTIDPPFFFFWALATCLAVKAIFDERQWAWPLAGVVAGLGFLTKYSMLLWLPFVLLFLAVDPKSRRWLKTRWPWVMVVIALVFTTPVVIWNAQHHWMGVAHVSSQTDTHEGNVFEFLGSQLGIINPAIAVLMIGSLFYALGRWGKTDSYRREMAYLVYIGLPFFIVCLLDSFISKVQPNWPAPAYFTLLVLTAYFIGTRLRSINAWKPWRGWFYGAIVIGVVMQPLLNDATALYPLITWVNQKLPKRLDSHGRSRPWLKPQNIDVAFKLRGIADPFASTISEYLKQLPAGSFVLCEDYQNASQLAFYLPGQPKTYFVGSYWTDPTKRRRRTQFDMWPDRQLDRPELIGKDAIYVGTTEYDPFPESFEKIEKLPSIVVRRNGLVIRSFPVWRCIGFKGIHRPAGEGSF